MDLPYIISLLKSHHCPMLPFPLDTEYLLVDNHVASLHWNQHRSSSKLADIYGFGDKVAYLGLGRGPFTMLWFGLKACEIRSQKVLSLSGILRPEVSHILLFWGAGFFRHKTPYVVCPILGIDENVYVSCTWAWQDSSQQTFSTGPQCVVHLGQPVDRGLNCLDRVEQRRKYLALV